MSHVKNSVRPVLLLLLLGGLTLVVGACTPQYPKCANDGHCKAGEFCVNALCQQCRGQSDCGACQQCTAGRCAAVPGCCGADGDCAAGQRCRAGSCGAECLGQNECGARQLCQGGRCVPVACLEDTDCAAGTRCQDHQCVGPETCTLRRIHFEFDQAELTGEARSILDENARCLKQQPAAVLVEGHCDERGTEEYNLALGERRARAAAKYLERLGTQQVRTISYGERRPLRPEQDESAWSENRRSEFVTR